MIVKLVDPKPGERICDPACGTGGFLVSAFNHIVRANTSGKALHKHGHPTGDKLKPAQWRFIEEQAFTGFDNDANMVKTGTPAAACTSTSACAKPARAASTFHAPSDTSRSTKTPRESVVVSAWP
jgi:type I restriction enzyme M protein